MAEQLSPEHMEKQHSHEAEPSQEVTTSKEHEPKRIDNAEHEHEQIESIKHKVEQEAKSGSEIKVSDKAASRAQDFLVSRQLKNEAFKRSIHRAQKHLTAPDRAFSKLIHQPVVDSLSKVGENTIARPSGVLAGAVVALIGTSYLLYSSKRYGYRYNYLIVIILFGGGYLLGLILELIAYTLRRPKAK